MGSLKRRIIEDLEPKDDPPMEVLGWIPAGERLPDEGIEVLGWQTWIPDAHWSEGVFTCVHREGVWRESYEPDVLPNITHWMPLPEPPAR